MNGSLPRILSLLGLPVLVALSGCNLADYEQRMLQSQANLKQHDEEAKLLDDPMEIPPPKEGGYVDIFFRAPRGINPLPDNRDKPQAGFIYHYPKSSMMTGMTPAGPGGQPTPPNPGPGTPPGVRPGPAPPGTPILPGMPGANESAAFLEGFAAYRKEDQSGTFHDDFLRQFPRSGEPVKKSRRITPLGFDPFDCETSEFTSGDGKSTYLIVVARLPGVTFGVGYRIDLGRAGAIQRALEVSLQTLVVGENADRARIAYKRDSDLRIGR
jgi:hypothetical protein